MEMEAAADMTLLQEYAATKSESAFAGWSPATLVCVFRSAAAGH
jgi:hypothetical protein